MAHAGLSLDRPTFLQYRRDGKELRTYLHGFLLFAVETQRHQPSLVTFWRATVSLWCRLCAAETLSCIFAPSEPCHRELRVAEQKKVCAVREEEWLGSAELLWHERMDVAQDIWVASSLPASSWGALAGQGGWGKRPPTAFASNIPLALPERRTVEDIHWCTQLHVVMRRKVVANLPHLPCLQHATNLCWLKITKRQWWETQLPWKHSHFT